MEEIISKRDLDKIHLINSINLQLITLYSNILEQELKKKLFGTADTKGEFKYYPNMDAGTLWYLLKIFKCKSILDLGSGPGLLLRAISVLEPKINYVGFEIEDILVAQGYNNNGVKIIKKDILKIVKKDITQFTAIYYWRPFYDIKLMNQFEKNLLSIITKGQIIICYQNRIIDLPEDYTTVYHFPYNIYIKK